MISESQRLYEIQQTVKKEEVGHPAMAWAYRYGEDLGARFIAEVKRLVGSGGVGLETPLEAVMATALYNLGDGVAGRRKETRREIANLQKF